MGGQGPRLVVSVGKAVRSRKGNNSAFGRGMLDLTLRCPALPGRHTRECATLRYAAPRRVALVRLPEGTSDGPRNTLGRELATPHSRQSVRKTDGCLELGAGIPPLPLPQATGRKMQARADETWPLAAGRVQK